MATKQMKTKTNNVVGVGGAGFLITFLILMLV